MGPTLSKKRQGCSVRSDVGFARLWRCGRTPISPVAALASSLLARRSRCGSLYQPKAASAFSSPSLPRAAPALFGAPRLSLGGHALGPSPKLPLGQPQQLQVHPTADSFRPQPAACVPGVHLTRPAPSRQGVGEGRPSAPRSPARLRPPLHPVPPVGRPAPPSPEGCRVREGLRVCWGGLGESSKGARARKRDGVRSGHSLRPLRPPLLPWPTRGRDRRGGRAALAPGAPTPAAPRRRDVREAAPLHPHPRPRQLPQPRAEVRLHLLSPEGESRGLFVVGV